MRRLKRFLLSAVPMATAFVMLVPSTSYASDIIVGDGVVTGSGQISPGLSATGAFQSVNFNGTVSGSYTSTNPPQEVVFTVDCVFAGGSNRPEDSATGAGHVTGSCGGTATVTPPVPPVTVPATVSCSLDYSRVLAVVAVSGTCTATAAGQTETFCVTGIFAFVPTSVNPTTSYLLAGDVVISPPPGKAPCPDAKP